MQAFPAGILPDWAQLRVILSFLLVLFFAPIASVRAQQPLPDQSAGKYLIIHADDAGMSHSVNLATFDAMENGVVSSASIMVPCPWFPEAAKYAKSNPELDFGLHLTLNSEWDTYRWGPVAERSQVPSLVDEQGFLWDNVGQVAEHAKADEVAIELRAQVERAKAFGVPITHLDTHMGALVCRADLVEVYVNLGLEYDLPVLFLRSVDSDVERAYPALAARGQALSAELAAAKLPRLDRLLQFYDEEDFDKRRQMYLTALEELEPGFHQIIIHCGIADAELTAITHSASRRDADRRIFADPALRQVLAELDIQLISWADMQKMQYPDR